jgi:transposase
MDTNPVKNLIRPVPLTRKRALFAGNDGTRTWKRCGSLLGTCKLDGVNPQRYLTVALGTWLRAGLSDYSIPPLMEVRMILLACSGEEPSRK